MTPIANLRAPSTQHLYRALDITAAVGGYRIAWIGPDHWNPVGDPTDPNGRDLEFPSVDAAWAARTAALAMWSDISLRLKGSR